AETRNRRANRLSARDWRFSSLAATGFVVFAALAAFFIDSGRTPSTIVVVTIVAAYALAAWVEFEVGVGAAVPTQLILVPMLFVLALGLVPRCVSAGLVPRLAPRYILPPAPSARSIQL